MRKRKTQPPKQNPPDENPADPNPPTIESMREALVQKLEAFVMQEQLQDCPRLACRRRKSCTRETACESRNVPREPSPEQWERSKAMLVRELARRRAEFQRAGSC